MTSGSSAASPRQASHSWPVSEVVSSPFWRPGQLGREHDHREREQRDRERLEQRRVEAARRVAPVRERVEDGAEPHHGERHRQRRGGDVGAAGRPGPATSGISAATNSVGGVDGPQRDRAAGW